MPVSVLEIRCPAGKLGSVGNLGPTGARREINLRLNLAQPPFTATGR